MYLDFKKAFDSVAHNELLLKLWKFGICGSLWLWTKAYLTNRLQYVAVGQSLSSALPILSVFLREIFLAHYLLQYLLTISPHPSRPPPFFSLPMMLNVFYSISGKLLPSKSTQRDLGVSISADLQWSSHYKITVSKAYMMTYVTLNLFSFYRGIYLPSIPSTYPSFDPNFNTALLSGIPISCLTLKVLKLFKEELRNSLLGTSLWTTKIDCFICIFYL